MDPQDYTAYRYNPLAFAQDILGFQPHPHQAPLLDPSLRKVILCCTRGWGKTQIASVLAAWHLAMRPGAVVLVVSETAEKAGELVQRAVQHLEKIGFLAKPDKLRRHGVRFANGSRILPVPQRDGSVRGYPATLILVDEAALVSDKVWTAISGTRASTFQRSTVWLMSTPRGRHGFYYKIWDAQDEAWVRVWVPADQCERISPAYLDEMRAAMDEEDFEREFMARFAQSRSGLFREEVIQRAVTASCPAIDLENPARFTYHVGDVLLADGKWAPRHGFYLGVDLGQSRDHSALALLEYAWRPTNRVCAVTRLQHHQLKLRLRWLHRVSLQTSYTDVAAVTARVLDHPELRDRTTTVVDATGARAFVDLLRQMKLRVQGVQITAGLATGHTPGGLVNLPKQELVLNLEALLRLGDLEIAAQLPCWKELLLELRQFERVRLPGGRLAYTGKNSGSDDLVMAVALATGWAWERHRAGFNLAARLRAELGHAA